MERRRRFLVVAALVVTLAAVFAPAAAQEAPPEEPHLTLFWIEGCPYCAAEREFLAELARSYPRLVVAEYEVSGSEANRDLFVATMERLGREAGRVPAAIIGDQVWVGWNDAVGREIRRAVAALFAAPETTTTAAPLGPAPPVTTVPPFTTLPPVTPSTTTTTIGTDSIIDVPGLGEVDVADRSLLVATLLIGFVDGLNPCSLWVLSILLGLVLHTGSRRRVIAVGVTFLVVTTALYGVFIAGIYSVLSYVAYLDWIRVGVAAIALAFGAINIKDYFAFGRGPSLSISEERKPALYRRMRRLAADETPLPAVLGGTTALAVGVSLIETPCTAGFPLLWADLLAAQEVGAATAGFLFAVYMLVFLADELAVFAIAVTTMRAAKLQERHGRLLKLVGGTVMVSLAGTLVFAPELMHSIGGALVVFLLAAALALAGVAFDRWWRTRRPPDDESRPSPPRTRMATPV